MRSALPLNAFKPPASGRSRNGGFPCYTYVSGRVASPRRTSTCCIDLAFRRSMAAPKVGFGAQHGHGLRDLGYATVRPSCESCPNPSEKRGVIIGCGLRLTSNIRYRVSLRSNKRSATPTKRNNVENKNDENSGNPFLFKIRAVGGPKHVHFYLRRPPGLGRSKHYTFRAQDYTFLENIGISVICPRSFLQEPPQQKNDKFPESTQKGPATRLRGRKQGLFANACVAGWPDTLEESSARCSAKMERSFSAPKAEVGRTPKRLVTSPPR